MKLKRPIFLQSNFLYGGKRTKKLAIIDIYLLLDFIWNVKNFVGNVKYFIGNITLGSFKINCNFLKFIFDFLTLQYLQPYKTIKWYILVSQLNLPISIASRDPDSVKFFTWRGYIEKIAAFSIFKKGL